jgi:hypothetical protein
LHQFASTSKNPFKIGDCYTSSAFNVPFPCKGIVHVCCTLEPNQPIVVGPDYHVLISRALTEADKYKFSSISLPILGADGSPDFPIERAAEIIFHELMKYTEREKQQRGLKLIRVVAQDHSSFVKLKGEYEKIKAHLVL